MNVRTQPIHIPVVFFVILALTLYRMWIVPHLGITLYVDEAQYWTWAQNLDWGYFSKPPVIAALIAATTSIAGHGILAVKLSALLLYPATALVLYRICQYLYDEKIAGRAALAFALLPMVSALGLFVSTDAPLLFFWTAALFFWLSALDNNRWHDWILLGLCCGLGLMSKYTMGIFLPCAGLHLLISNKHRRHLTGGGIWSALAVALLIVLPNLWWNWQHGFPTLHHTADITHIEGSNNKQGNLLEFLAAQALSLGPGMAIGFIGSLTYAWKQRRDEKLHFLLCFSLPLLILVCIQAWRSEANGNWAAPAWVCGCVLATVWLSQKRTAWWIAALSINTALMIAVYHLGDAYRIMGKNIPIRIDPLKRARGWDRFAGELRPYLQAYPDAVILSDNRSTIAHLSYELRDLHRTYAEWNPTGRVHDHYTLTASFDRRYRGHSALLIQEGHEPDSSAIIERFDAHRKLVHIRTSLSPHFAIEADLTLLSNFKGY